MHASSKVLKLNYDLEKLLLQGIKLNYDKVDILINLDFCVHEKTDKWF